MKLIAKGTTVIQSLVMRLTLNVPDRLLNGTQSWRLSLYHFEGVSGSCISPVSSPSVASLWSIALALQSSLYNGSTLITLVLEASLKMGSSPPNTMIQLFKAMRYFHKGPQCSNEASNLGSGVNVQSAEKGSPHPTPPLGTVVTAQLLKEHFRCRYLCGLWFDPALQSPWEISQTLANHFLKCKA